ncbi:MAG: hypothetical protein QMB51_01645 [Patescibacteria group bacterium]
MRLSSLNNFVLSDVLSCFDSCYLGVVSIFLKKDIHILEAFALAEIYVSDVKYFIKNKDEIILDNNTINYISQNKKVNISINIKTNEVVINSYLSKDDIDNLSYILLLNKTQKSA